jgi:2-isopropylmalate synthase
LTAYRTLLNGEGNGPINAAVNALKCAGINIQVRSYEERSMTPIGEDGNARACAFMEIAGNEQWRMLWRGRR